MQLLMLAALYSLPHAAESHTVVHNMQWLFSMAASVPQIASESHWVITMKKCTTIGHHLCECCKGRAREQAVKGTPAAAAAILLCATLHTSQHQQTVPLLVVLVVFSAPTWTM